MKKEYERPKIKTEDHQTLWITYTEYRTGGEVMAGQEGNSYPDYEDEYIDWSPKKISLTEGSSRLRDEVKVKFPGLVKPKDNVYIIVVRYRTGDTFSSSSGNAYVEGAYNDSSTADLIAAMIENDSYPGEHNPWQGYFERLEGVEIHEMTVEL